MKKIIALLLVLTLVLSGTALAACGGGGGGAVVDNGGAETAVTNGGEGGEGNGGGNGGEEVGGNGNGGEESLEDILEQGEDIVSARYEAVLTSTGAPQQIMKIWFKQNKMRVEMTQQGQAAVLIANFDSQVAYLYFPAMNVAYQMDFEQVEDLPLADAQSVTDYEYQIIGTETLDDKECLVVEYTTEEETVKMWIWKEYGFPIRAEITRPSGTTIAEYRNLEFGDIDDSMFELPEGVQMMSSQ